MKKTGKNSPKNRQSDDTLIYILLFILFVMLVGGLVWFYWPPKEKEWNFDNFDYAEELGKPLVSPKAKEVSKLISGNRSRIKTARRVLEGKMKGRKLSDEEKKDVQNELNKVNNYLDEILKKTELKKLEENNPDILASLYSEIYKQGEIAVRLRAKTSFHRPSEQYIKQMKAQNEWENSVAEEETKEIMNRWIEKWYQRAREEIIRPGREKPLTEPLRPLKIDGKKVDNPSQDQINSFKKKHELTNGKIVDLTPPFNLKFNGYWGFLTEEDKKDSTEGTETFGLTKSGDKGVLLGDKLELEYIGECNRPISIGLEKKLFFNRLGYEQWITSYDKENLRYFDICFEEVVETIAHELAHAIINTIKIIYDGEEGGGHGKWFYDVLQEIEGIIKNSPDFPEFETWWKESAKVQPKWAADNVLVDEKGHWDEWKYWYIGGGVGILAIGLAVVVVFYYNTKN